MEYKRRTRRNEYWVNHDRILISDELSEYSYTLPYMNMVISCAWFLGSGCTVLATFLWGVRKPRKGLKQMFKKFLPIKGFDESHIRWELQLLMYQHISKDLHPNLTRDNRSVWNPLKSDNIWSVLPVS